ncbi:hypothetical protein EPUS_06281 [Endocarpon pusillum Z07020]|uniref:Uncharacterized protein n=1 Tax=Endocarpon pusillum (strain Z07020 / HMAS-L-300199) TaxID=1263415 RepID=U1GX27_ENDPU|nr:uncharacterized protein EPUS_06281 [Endocarpon pusillum Z07020]ERF77063.1 hypothetical protein EPUS_06281 [Endocarpon pusillum Z07020]
MAPLHHPLYSRGSSRRSSDPLFLRSQSYCEFPSLDNFSSSSFLSAKGWPAPRSKASSAPSVAAPRDWSDHEHEHEHKGIGGSGGVVG